MAVTIKYIQISNNIKIKVTKHQCGGIS